MLRWVFMAWSRIAMTADYRPEKHYMRGPGPKTLEMIGRQFREETNPSIVEPLPERWLTLLRALDSQDKERAAGPADRDTGTGRKP